MNIEVDDVIKFKNGEYLVLDVIKSKNNTYLYLINNNEYINDISIVKAAKENEKIIYTHIDNDDEFRYILNKIFLNNIEYEIALIDNE